MNLRDWRRRLAWLGDTPSAIELSAAGDMLRASLHDAAMLGSTPRVEEAGALVGKTPWAPIEVLTWHHAEHVARYLLGAPLVRGANGLLDACAAFAVDRRFGRGRQNLVGVLGRFGRRDYGDTLGPLLADEQVYGHAVGALRRAEVADYGEQAALLFKLECALWVKIAAADYVDFCHRVQGRR